MKYLVTGAAGFIGFHVTQRLLTEGHQVVSFDNINDYYDINLKKSRLTILNNETEFEFHQIDLVNKTAIDNLFKKHKFDRVIHLAAQAGVRYSLENPYSYIDANVIGHLNILDNCRQHEVGHLLYASSSSVYGLNRKLPFSTDDSVDHPVSLYAATKKSNELMSHTYSHLFGIPTTGLRFFTVYGPWGRPDMALFKFTQSIIEDKPIDVYNYGDMMRDFTFIDDVTEAIIRLQAIIPQQNSCWTVEQGSPATSSAPYRVYNIGNSQPVKLLDYIEAIELALGKKAHKNLLPMQPGDIVNTEADTTQLYDLIKFRPQTSVIDGVKKFVDWYRTFYKV